MGWLRSVAVWLGYTAREWGLAICYFLWEHNRLRLEKPIASRLGKLMGRFLAELLLRSNQGEIKMEKDVQVGSAGQVQLTLSGGKATVAINLKESVAGGAVQGEASISASIDASVLLDQLFAEIEKKSPAGAAPFEEAVKSALKDAVAKIQ